MVIPKRIALCYDENAIIVEYGYKDKLYHYKIQLTKAMAELQVYGLLTYCFDFSGFVDGPIGGCIDKRT